MTATRNNPLRAFLGLAGLLTVWQLIVAARWVPEEYLPGVPAVFGALVEQFSDRAFWVGEALTLLRAIGGLLLATVCGVGVAVLAARFRWVEQALAPLVQIMLSLPPAALVPLSIFALGLGPKLFAFIIWYSAVWVIYLGTNNALRSNEPVQLNMARTFGYGRWETLWRVRLPAAAPEVFTSVRLAAAGALMATVATEMLAGKDGLGFLLYDTAFSLRIPEMFALLLTAGFNGVLLNQAILRMRRYVSGWHEQLSATARA
ncbi:ABC transporter permease [Variovorax dokdonensis]|uniref:ABC transporter permease n=1 Tax=Variovorax dokdonensis TaxID=344883 RepID=A0ABT7NCE8_9BURK|nr:ABC transporter permease [Variovorax dokdonensis]MDM0045631.1 ABC transporter permease [Variovorax dokdonensis]